ncbi:enoyl-CoA hydratase-related protein [Sediminibacillus albus]|uniref:Enoyl-CoA hydratase/carnithine racemase n=1 Tax=Sediminibacillus albus TaxID=407036 RepID=A0A1G8VVU9_9BACI|nr:enoyl-CoA hydratase-related protein [Sediminibacillus albus]SDJ69927.1 Enoyl-CoA hydratase/carnithine racemase [Sediminibacillus albus]
MTSLINYDKKSDHTAVIRLERPQAANALSLALLEELNATLQQISMDKTIRCLIITGAGDKNFCAGADLKERMTMTNQQVYKTVQYIGETINNIDRLPIPTIAMMNGSAYGGGLEIALACDIRMAAAHANMGLTETSLGIIPGAGGTQRLSRQVGLAKAKELIFTAQAITAAKAKQISLVEYCYPLEQLADKTEALAAMIGRNAPIALKQAKQAITQGYDVDIHSALKVEQHCYQQTIETEDRLEGLAAFKEKRPPHFIGK